MLKLKNAHFGTKPCAPKSHKFSLRLVAARYRSLFSCYSNCQKRHLPINFSVSFGRRTEGPRKPTEGCGSLRKVVEGNRIALSNDPTLKSPRLMRGPHRAKSGR